MQLHEYISLISDYDLSSIRNDILQFDINGELKETPIITELQLKFSDCNIVSIIKALKREMLFRFVKNSKRKWRRFES